MSERKKPAESFVAVNGHHTNVKEVKLPASGRLFRSAWQAPKGGAIQLDVNKVAGIVHETRRAWRTWLESRPFTYARATFDNDADSQRRIATVLKRAEMAIDRNEKFERSWTDHQGNEHEADAAWILGLFEAMEKHNDAVHAQNVMRKQQINEARDDENLTELQRLHVEMTAMMSR